MGNMVCVSYFIQFVVVFLLTSEGVMAATCDNNPYHSALKSITSLTELVTTLTDNVANIKMSVAEMKENVDQIEDVQTETKISIRAMGFKAKNNGVALRNLRKSLTSTKREVAKSKKSIKQLGLVFANNNRKLGGTISNLNKTLATTTISKTGQKKELKLVGVKKKCVRLCALSTVRGKTQWKIMKKTQMYVDVDMKPCGFTKKPTIVTALEGITYHATATGVSHVLIPNKDRFRVFVFSKYATSGKPNRFKWNIDMMAVGPIC